MIGDFLYHIEQCFSYSGIGFKRNLFWGGFGDFVEGILGIFRWLNWLSEIIIESLPYNVFNRLMVSLIEVFFISLIFLLPVIIVIKILKSGKRRRWEILYHRYYNIVNLYLDGEDTDRVPLELRQVRTRFRKNVLIAVILKFDGQLSGRNQTKLRKLYLHLKLDKESIRKIYKRQWNEKIKGIRELSQLKVKKENNRILDFLNSSNDILRIEAQLGMVKLLPFVPFAFLDSLDKPFTVWEQMNVYQLIRDRRVEIPEFHLWLDHWNDSVVMFSLDMIRILKQKEAVPKVLELLSHDNDWVKGKVIKTLVELESEQAVAKLKEYYDLMEESNQLNIIRSIGKIAAEEEIGFLEKLLDVKNFKVRMASCQAIAQTGPSGMSRLEGYLTHSDPQLQSIIKHVLDPRI